MKHLIGILLLAGLGISIQAANAADDVGPSLLTTVTYLNGVRIHSKNCNVDFDESQVSGLVMALNAGGTSRERALRSYIQQIYDNLYPTAPKQCNKELLEGYKDNFHRSFGELKAVTQAIKYGQ